jgi:hypothetical protein
MHRSHSAFRRRSTRRRKDAIAPGGETADDIRGAAISHEELDVVLKTEPRFATFNKQCKAESKRPPCGGRLW